MLGLSLDNLKLVLESLSLDDLKLIAKSRGIKGYKNMSGKRLLRALSKPKRDQKKSLRNREQKNLLTQKIKEIEKSLSTFKTYHDHDDAKCIGIRDIGNLFNQSTDKDYYKQIKTKIAFNGNYIEYESNGDKNKIYQLKNILI